MGYYKEKMIDMTPERQAGYGEMLLDQQRDEWAEIELDDYRLHEEAGLVDGGLDDDGERLWIGKQKHWNKYKFLINKINE